MVMENIVHGLKNTEIMNIKMSENHQLKKKTRRGKKNRQKKFLLPGNTSDVISTILENEENCKLKCIKPRGSLRMRGVRPWSPKAPMNSTQFLIDDKIDRENKTESRFCDFQNFPSQNSLIVEHSDQITEETDFHRLSLPIFDEDFSNLDFYDGKIDHKMTNNCTEDAEYEPFSVEETEEFIGDDFEKVYNFHNISDNFVKMETKVQEISKLSKFEIINKMFDLESRLKNEETNHSESDELKKKISQLRKENVQLKNENASLRNMLN